MLICFSKTAEKPCSEITRVQPGSYILILICIKDFLINLQGYNDTNNCTHVQSSNILKKKKKHIKADKQLYSTARQVHWEKRMIHIKSTTESNCYT